MQGKSKEELVSAHCSYKGHHERRTWAITSFRPEQCASIDHILGAVAAPSEYCLNRTRNYYCVSSVHTASYRPYLDRDYRRGKYTGLNIIWLGILRPTISVRIGCSGLNSCALVQKYRNVGCGTVFDRFAFRLWWLKVTKQFRYLSSVRRVQDPQDGQNAKYALKTRF